MLCAGCAAPRNLQVTTVAEDVDRAPACALIPAPVPISVEIPTDWRVVQTPQGPFFALTEAQHDQLILWLEDAARFTTAAQAQLEYYRGECTSD